MNPQPNPSGARIRLVPDANGATPPADAPAAAPAESLVESYQRLADVFHDVLSEQSLDGLLDRIADALTPLIPYDDMHIYEVDMAKREMIPRLARSRWAAEILAERFPFGEGLTGWAVEHREPVLANQAHLDPRVRFVTGTPIEPEALIVVPLIARGNMKGTLNIYREGEDEFFTDEEKAQHYLWRFWRHLPGRGAMSIYDRSARISAAQRERASRGIISRLAMSTS